MIYSTLLLGAALASSASAACTREQLIAATDAYITAQAAGDPAMPALAENVTYLENDAPMDITTGVLSQAITIDFNRSLHDSVECATFTEISAATNAEPYVIATRMLFTDDKITTIQSVVANNGDWAFNATGQLYWTKTENWDPIPEDQRDSRDVIKAAGDAYLDSWGDGTVKVPYGSPCARLEGGSYTGRVGSTANTCTMPQFPSAFKIENRRYVIDEEVGGLDIFNDFPFIDADKPDGTSSTNFFRIEGGMIRYIHETTICTNPNCGR
ncbi:uncharacterized protein F4807DRAFT_445963 [Annulohypoxylon truncatum]|uniref:uncharacterized protein n=1 Tax=Annulohypoxylon truncatum TaxID=327061 RepID=UPI002007FC0B|nr:uncharacterized protein F4807DRAFT_445963 [Annulohypoxylon truncatum]KAI1204714.1 hypothetical protein F4807DRAFT_445963 [Annulohypoxylon truncatum]